MNILMLAPSHSVHAKRPLNSLLENGINVFFVDFENPYPEGKENFYFLPHPGFNDEIMIPYLKEIYSQIKPEAVHVHWVDYRAYQCVKAGVKPLILSPWGSDINEHFYPTDNYENAIKNGVILNKELLKMTLRNADLTIIDDISFIDKLKFLSDCDINTEFIHLGINTEKFSNKYENESLYWRRKYEVPCDAKLFFSPRALTKMYNHHLILEAFAEAVHNSKQNAYLILKIYNDFSGKEYQMELRRLAIELNVHHLVRWVKKVPFDELPIIYAASDYILNYPVMDTFPISFLEASASECNVITCDLESYKLKEVENTYFFFDKNNPAELSKIIFQGITNNMSVRKEGLISSREFVKKNYDEKIYINKLLQVYEKYSLVKQSA